MNDKVRKALDTNEVKGAIGRFRSVRDFFDIGDMSAESDGNILADAIEEALSALTQPRPEAREEDIDERVMAEAACDAWLEQPRNYSDICPKYGQGDKALRAAGFIDGYISALSRLAEPTP